MVMVIGRLLAGVFPLRRSFLFLSVPACTGFVFRVSIKKIKGKKKKISPQIVACIGPSLVSARQWELYFKLLNVI